MHLRVAVALAAGLTALAMTTASASVLIRVDKAAQIMTVTVDGAQRYAWPVSTGMADYDTPAGEFQPFRMERDHFSREWDDAPMPYSIFFTQEGHAIHGSFALVKEQGVKNTKVTLTGEIPDAVVARGEPGSIFSEEDTSAPPRKRTAREVYAGPRYYYRERPYYAPRRYYGGFPFGW